MVNCGIHAEMFARDNVVIHNNWLFCDAAYGNL
jgi:hypothetical protein